MCLAGHSLRVTLGRTWRSHSLTASTPSSHTAPNQITAAVGKFNYVNGVLYEPQELRSLSPSCFWDFSACQLLCGLLLSGWSGHVCRPVFSFVSKCFVVCCYVSLKLTPQGFINLSCQLRLGARGLYSWCVCLTSAGRLLIKNKGQEPLRSWHSAASGHLSSSHTEKPPADFTEVRPRVWLCVSCFCRVWRSSDWHWFIFMVIWNILFPPEALKFEQLVSVPDPRFLWRTSCQYGQ